MNGLDGTKEGRMVRELQQRDVLVESWQRTNSVFPTQHQTKVAVCRDLPRPARDNTILSSIHLFPCPARHPCDFPSTSARRLFGSWIPPTAHLILYHFECLVACWTDARYTRSITCFRLLLLFHLLLPSPRRCIDRAGNNLPTTTYLSREPLPLSSRWPSTSTGHH